MTGISICIALACVTAWAARWQTQRAEQKIALEQKIQLAQDAPVITVSGAVDHLISSTLEHRTLRLNGQWLPQQVVYLDNRPLESNGTVRFGVHVLMPFKLVRQSDGAITDLAAEQADVVLVNRGWTAKNPSDVNATPNNIATPAGVVQIEGIVRASPGSFRASGQDMRTTRLWSAFDFETYERIIGQQARLNTARWVVLQTSPSTDQDPLIRQWPLPSQGVSKHRGYAFQWAAMCVLSLLFGLAIVFEPWITRWKIRLKAESGN